MRIYIDGPWDRDVREYGAPMRIYLHTRHWLWIIGLWPTIKGQVWTASEGYTDRFRWIVRHPKMTETEVDNMMSECWDDWNDAK